MRTKRLANSLRWARDELIFRKPEANTEHLAYTIPFVFAQETDKF